MLLYLSVERQIDIVYLYRQIDKGTLYLSDAQLERESCSVGPNGASWPMHSCGNTARKG
jgi:hypothetical protein